MTKGPRIHKETWWWNEEVAEAIREKKIKYRKWERKHKLQEWTMMEWISPSRVEQPLYCL